MGSQRIPGKVIQIQVVNEEAKEIGDGSKKYEQKIFALNDKGNIYEGQYFNNSIEWDLVGISEDS